MKPKNKNKKSVGVRITDTKICTECLASFIPDDDEDICIICKLNKETIK